MDIKARVDEYNKGVALLSTEKAHLKATSDILKSQVSEGLRRLSECLGEVVSIKNIKELRDREEGRVLEMLEQGELALSRHKEAMARIVSEGLKGAVGGTIDIPKTGKAVKEAVMGHNKLNVGMDGDTFLDDVGGMFDDL
jgi:hypothetical protein